MIGRQIICCCNSWTRSKFFNHFIFASRFSKTKPGQHSVNTRSDAPLYECFQQTFADGSKTMLIKTRSPLLETSDSVRCHAGLQTVYCIKVQRRAVISVVSTTWFLFSSMEAYVAMLPASAATRWVVAVRAGRPCIDGCCWAAEEPWCSVASARWAGRWTGAGDSVRPVRTTADSKTTNWRYTRIHTDQCCFFQPDGYRVLALLATACLVIRSSCTLKGFLTRFLDFIVFRWIMFQIKLSNHKGRIKAWRIMTMLRLFIRMINQLPNLT